MNILVGLLVYNFDIGLIRAVESILPYTRHNITFHIYIHSNRFSEVLFACQFIKDKYPNNIVIFNYGINRGYAKSCNDILYNGYNSNKFDLVFLTQQDIWFNTPGAFDNFIDKAIEYNNTKLVISAIPNDCSDFVYASIIVTKLGWLQIGCFDENFFPAQYEDLDYHTRASLLTNTPKCDIFKYKKKDSKILLENEYRKDIIADMTHTEMSIRDDAQLYLQQSIITSPLNRAYYIKKWGGDINDIQYNIPFNDLRFSNHITYVSHEKPYGTYNRTDQNIVRI